MGADEQWYEMDDKEARKKASQGTHFGHVVYVILLKDDVKITLFARLSPPRS